MALWGGGIPPQNKKFLGKLKIISMVYESYCKYKFE